MTNQQPKSDRRGSVYLAVLGTAMIVSILALSALALQRVQNRMLSASADVRQAQLNAEAAIELGLLAIKNDSNWRTTYASGSWFSDRGTGEGACSLTVIDPVDANLAGRDTDPIVMTGVGTAGKAVQQVVRTVDSYVEPLSCLRCSVAVGDTIALNGSVLRASNSGLIAADSTSASGSTIYGRVQAVSVSGSTYDGTTSQVSAADRPAMPDWSTVFDYYKTNGTEIDVNSLPTATPNLGRNVNLTNGNATYWTGSPPSVSTADVAVSNAQDHTSGSGYCLTVANRNDWNAGAAQYVDDFVKPNQQYTVGIWAYLDSGGARNFHVSLYTKGSGTQSVDSGPSVTVPVGVWTEVSAILTAPSWSGNLEYAFVKIAGADSGNTDDFYTDDLNIQETTSGRFIYRRVLGPGVNTLGGATNSQGLYWIDCNDNRLIIERSRVKGTLLVINPGNGSMIGAGPIYWTPATPGYPALLVDADTAVNADFTIAATNRSLSEAENGVNFNPVGVSQESFGTDNEMNDIYPSEIQGLVVVRDGLTFQNTARVLGSVIVGDDLIASSGSLEVVYLPDALYSPPPGFSATPSHVSRPLSVHKAVLP